LRKGTFLTCIVGAAILGATGSAWAQSAQTGNAADQTVAALAAPAAAYEERSGESQSGLGTDIKLYFTAPLRWNLGDWAWVGGALAAIGVSHHYDSQVRTHFVQNLPTGQSSTSDDVKDLIPTVAVLGLTWAYSAWTHDPDGQRETWAMAEAAGLASVTTYGLKYIARREGPDQTSDPNEWFKSGGKSFPSEHATVAFAVGTVLAESGNDDYRWLRRLLGYGLGVATSYARLKHNAHWLSDVVAGAAVGAASARFAMNRTYQGERTSGFMLVPVPGGAMLSYRATLP
jgi:membrane-associated phospholipid phosphatase